jgi:hypothetical protein
MNRKKLDYAELALLSLVWIVLLVIPVLFREDADNSLRRSIANQLEVLIPVSVLFLLNRFIFVPVFLFRGKIAAFVLLLSGSMLILSLGSWYYDTRINLPSGKAVREQPLDRPGPPVQRPPQTDRPPKPEGPPKNRPYTGREILSPEQETAKSAKRQPRPVPPFANFLVLSVLLVGFDTGLRSGLRWIHSENEKVELEKEHVATQLVLLQNQISPHFFMNTLNNIHSLVDIDTGEAKDAIIKLSKMMRYLLYETAQKKTSLKKETEFIESYVDLMKLRYNANVKINLSLPAIIPEREIPPFLFLSIIENAFKHGISYEHESFVEIRFSFSDDRLLLVVRNSKAPKQRGAEYSGIGIDNTRKRLDLLFGNTCHLDLFDEKELFTVNLSIPI